MSKTEHDELPRRPEKIHTWGHLQDTILMMHNQQGHQFLLEQVDDGIFDLTICTYSQKLPNHPGQKRTEYVLTTNKAQLQMLIQQIKEAANL